MRETNPTVNRRKFIQASSAAIAVPAFVSASALGLDDKPAASDRVTLGIVGLGSRGFNLLDEFLRQGDARIVALCDVDSKHYRDRKWGEGRPMGLDPARQTAEQHYQNAKSGTVTQSIQTTADFRELCDRADIDAVVVATPDHWHALCTLRALREGKDVYCEKPLTHTFLEGRLVYQEVARRQAVFQTGSQQRSDARFRHAVELVLNGHVGSVREVQVGLPAGYDEPQGDATVQAPPDHLDYDFWCGPAPSLPYMRARHHRWWRGHRAYGGGVLMDWIGHHNDIAHWGLGMDRSGPVSVEAVGWSFPNTDVYDSPEEYEIRCRYPGDGETVISSSNPVGTKFVGDDGWVYVRRGRLEASDSRWLRTDFERGPRKVYTSSDHAKNFLDCVKSRTPCVAPAETAHRSITPGHLAYVAQKLGRPLRWDAENERVVDDPDANRLLNQSSYRQPWKLES